MNRYFLDTSVIIHALRGRPAVYRFLEHTDGEFSSSFVCFAELYEGVYRAKNRRTAALQISEFASGLSEIIGLDMEIAKQFGQLRAQLHQHGLIIEDLDILIAATCLVHRLTLVTFNRKHFSRIANLVMLEEEALTS